MFFRGQSRKGEFGNELSFEQLKRIATAETEPPRQADLIKNALSAASLHRLVGSRQAGKV